VIQMHGYGQRTTNEWPALGLSVPAWMSDLSNGLMVEGNANLIRWMHVTPLGRRCKRARMGTAC
jgi:beta-galactosidase